MALGSRHGTLEDFARSFLSYSIRRPEDIRTERLADAFRLRYDLPPFPSLNELLAVCSQLGIRVDQLPDGSAELLGVNTWQGAGWATIYLRSDLSTRLAETTLGHEIREVLENAFKQLPFYEGMNTSDNAAMNGESNQFAGCLLMQGVATRQRLDELGFDFAQFAQEKGRSLASVFLRTQELYPADRAGPVMGAWLFEAPWDSVQAGLVDWHELVVRNKAHLCGFSMRKGARGAAGEAWLRFPKSRHSVLEHPVALSALEQGCPVLRESTGFDLFGEHDFVVAAEPFFVRDVPWRVLMVAIRRDCLPMVAPWLQRLRDAATETRAGPP